MSIAVRLKVLKTLIMNPKKIISLGYQSMVRMQHEVDFEKKTVEKKHHKNSITNDRPA